MANETKLDNAINECLKKLNFVERLVFEFRFGIRDGECLLHEEIALILNRPVAKIIQIEKIALRKLNKTGNIVDFCDLKRKKKP